MSLGAALHVHSPRLTRKAGGVLATLALAIGMWWARSAMKPTQPTLVLLITLVFSLASVGLAVSWWRDKKMAITVYERGIGWTRGGKATHVAFDEIANVSEFMLNGRPVALILALHDGTETRIPADVSDRARLLASLGAHVRPSSLPRARLR